MKRQPKRHISVHTQILHRNMSTIVPWKALKAIYRHEKSVTANSNHMEVRAPQSSSQIPFSMHTRVKRRNMRISAVRLISSLQGLVQIEVDDCRRNAHDLEEKNGRRIEMAGSDRHGQSMNVSKTNTAKHSTRESEQIMARTRNYEKDKVANKNTIKVRLTESLTTAQFTAKVTGWKT